MRCPACSIDLSRQSVPSRYGSALELDVCDSCGGVFVGRDGIYRIGPQTLDRLDWIGPSRADLDAGGPCPPPAARRSRA